jgi:beta-lactamase superfamily II metal-dependent hydrolase
LLKGPNGTTVLLEAGNTGRGNDRVVPYLRSIGIMPTNGLDYTIAGHQHCDHLGGLDEVIRAHYDVRERNFFNGSTFGSTAAAGECVPQWKTAAATTTAGAPVRMPVGTIIPLGNGASLTAIAVNGKLIGGGTVAVSNENDRSIAVLIKYGGFDYLWASDMGGGNIDNACTGRHTTQVDVETSVIQAISPGGVSPLISAGGIDVINVNHHGSESSTNMNWMNLAAPALAIIPTGAGQGPDFHLPRINVVDKVLLAEATSCITAPPALVLQTEEGTPTGAETSFVGFSVGNIKVTTDGQTDFTVSADGEVSEGPDERAAAGLPRTFLLDDGITPLAPATGTDISNWRLVQANSSGEFTFPVGTTIPDNGYVIVARNSTKEQFETVWRAGVPLPSNVVFINAHGPFPVINGSERYTLFNDVGAKIDGPSAAMTPGGGKSQQRKDPCLSAGLSGSWNVVPASSATPGAGAGAGCSKGVVINEFSDIAGTGNFIFEFVELHNDK